MSKKKKKETTIYLTIKDDDSDCILYEEQTFGLVDMMSLVFAKALETMIEDKTLYDVIEKGAENAVIRLYNNNPICLEELMESALYEAMLSKKLAWVNNDSYGLKKSKKANK
jgi:hypothetical protein